MRSEADVVVMSEDNETGDDVLRALRAEQAKLDETWYRRLRRRRSIDRKTSSRRDGGARDESLVAFLSQFSFSHFSMTTKRIARVAGTSSSSRWTPVRFIFFDVARTTRVKARRDARHARHSVLMSRGGVIGCAVLSCVRFERK